jgi:hypothetical protein
MMGGVMIGRVRVRASIAACVASWIGCGCASRGSTVVAPIEVAIAPIGTLPASPPITGTGEAGPRGCSVRLSASPIEKSTSGCYLDEHISDGPGVLNFPCSGEGAAEAVFGEHHYVGRVRQGEVELEHLTELDWEDGCRWGTTATITGIVVGGSERGPKRLSWSYLDHVITGTKCSGVCRAKADITVTPIRGGMHGAGATDEDND